MIDRVLGIVVTYYPSGDELSRLIRTLSAQLDDVLIVDNTPTDGKTARSALDGLLPDVYNFEIDPVGKNIGIAAAQNRGIEAALARGYDFVIFSDQDSLPAPDMLSVLKECYGELTAKGIKVGCIAPQYYDSNTRRPHNLQAVMPGKKFYKSRPGDSADPWVEVVTVISSGSLIPCPVLGVVGPMREDFFIDQVDMEWCHRSRSMGFHLYGTSRTRLVHRLGEAGFSYWMLGWKRQNQYSAFRLYFRFRNFVLLCRTPHVPFPWCLRASLYWILEAWGHVFFGRHRLASGRAIMKGLMDGLMGRTGLYK